MRSGDEPSHARSPLRMRLTLALCGLVSWSAGSVAFTVVGASVLAAACSVGACVAAVNVAVVMRRIRSGPHWQPGPQIPLYSHLPPRPTPRRVPHPIAPHDVRVQRYLLLMGATLLLLLTAWTVLSQISMPLAMAGSLLAMAMLPIAVVAAGAGSLGAEPALGHRPGQGTADGVGRLPGPRPSREAGAVHGGRNRRQRRRFGRRHGRQLGESAGG